MGTNMTYASGEQGNLSFKLVVILKISANKYQSRMASAQACTIHDATLTFLQTTTLAKTEASTLTPLL